jgi:hypothetical protein
MPLDYITIFDKLIQKLGPNTLDGRNLTMLRENMAEQCRQILELAARAEQLEAENKKLAAQSLENEATNLAAENNRLMAELAPAFEEFQRTQQKKPPGDKCPYCQHNNGRLQEIKPDPTFGPMGVKIHYFRCDNADCGKSYDKQVDP